MSHSHKETIHYISNSEMGMFDTHAHLYDARFSEEGTTPEDILTRASKAGVTDILIPGDSIESSKAAFEFATKYNGFEGVTLYAACGVHPHEASTYDDDAEETLKKWLSEREKYRIKALGEIGLDYYYDFSPRDVQKNVFERQLNLAFEADIPFILHERDASGDSTEILRSYYKSGRLLKTPGVCHCCSCSPEIAKILVDMGFYIGFDGPLTFKNNKRGIDVCRETPLDRIVIETDSPYLTPEPNRGKTNEPEFVPFVAEKIAEIKGISSEDAFKILTDNAKKLYRID